VKGDTGRSGNREDKFIDELSLVEESERKGSESGFDGAGKGQPVIKPNPLRLSPGDCQLSSNIRTPAVQ
jgi:hypothetical protein